MPYNRFWSRSTYHSSAEERTVPVSAKVGVLLINLGTPQNCDSRSVRRYLREFLFDPRIVEVNPFLWRLVMNLFILPFRPPRSARLYRNIWTKEGSPLLLHTSEQAGALKAVLVAKYGEALDVDFAMSYGEPSVKRVMRTMAERGCERFLILPMFPQYSATSTGAVLDVVMKELRNWRWVPALRWVNEFAGEDLYIEALASQVRRSWQEKGKGDILLISFHGIPVRYFENGDPYYCYCHKTARLLAESLGLTAEQYKLTFQSQFGREKWLEPFTDEVIVELAKRGKVNEADGQRPINVDPDNIHPDSIDPVSIDIVCPGFVCDCLETLDEIARESRKIFTENGGGKFNYISCVNSHPTFIAALKKLCIDNLGGWL